MSEKRLKSGMCIAGVWIKSARCNVYMSLLVKQKIGMELQEFGLDSRATLKFYAVTCLRA
jgi:hypothetical protein